MTATQRTAFHRYSFNTKDSAGLILDLVSSIYNYDEKVTWSQLRIENDTLITGSRYTRGWAPDRKIYFAISLSKPMISYTITRNEDPEYNGFGKRGMVFEDYPEVEGKNIRAFIRLKPLKEEELLVKVGLSAVDVNGALKNIVYESPEWNFDEVRERAAEEWKQELSKIIIEGTQEQKEIFYTSLYHTLLAPVTYFDSDRRYRGLDGSIHKAIDFNNYTIYSLWDTYRALHPLLTITQTNRVADMINSMLAHREQSAFGILPVWSFHANETWCMIGYHAVSVIADAYLKGIDGIDPVRAMEAMMASATYEPYDGLEHYMKYGYVPIDLENEGGSKTLEYAYDDWCIARMAKKMGNDDVYNYFIRRAENYKNIFDSQTRFMRAKLSDGTWREPFDPLYAQYGGDYTEGNAWQYSWYVPHDVRGLIELMGGEEIFLARLDSLFELEGDEEKYKHVEDIAGLIGQYAHGNEPSQHIAYLYNYAGQPWRSQERIHQVMNNLFDNTPYGICGNEDCGQMSAWYIFSSLGFYPVSPGSLEYVIGSPCIPEARLFMDNGNEFVMQAKNLTSENIYIQSASLNGEPLTRCFIKHDEIMAGGALIFEMGPEPNTNWASDVDARPYSLSKVQ
jgi:predicted alpha-1,2-mannosidase